ncbi:hypothetical protein BDAP_002667 [Binucleata daphniae]
MINSSLVFSVAIVSLCSLSFGISLTSFECINKSRKTATEIENLFFNDSIPLTDLEWSILISVICLGALLSSIFHSYVHVNMKKKLCLNNLFYIAGSVLILLLSNFYTVLLGRLLIGVAIGVACCIVPSYLHNISPPNLRGTLGTCHQLAIVIGVFLGQLLNYFFNDTQTWKYVYYIILVYLLLQTICMLFVVDVQEDKIVENAGFIELFKCKQATTSLITAAVLHVTQQFSCFNGVINYSTKILEEMSYPDLCSIFLGLISIFSTILSLFFIDRFGRKILLLVSLGLVIAGLTMLSFNLKLGLALCIYISGFNFGLGPITWMLSDEIFPGKYADAGIRYGVSINWISNALVLLVFPILDRIFDYSCFLVFAFICTCAYVYILVKFKETQKREPEFQ